MSVGSQALERSALEAKDRESLQQIATAMGGKPGSRAKKADIIDLILELAGVTTEATPSAAEVKAAPRKRAPRGRTTDAEQSHSADTDSGAGVDTDATATDDGAGTDVQGVLPAFGHAAGPAPAGADTDVANDTDAPDDTDDTDDTDVGDDRSASSGRQSHDTGSTGSAGSAGSGSGGGQGRQAGQSGQANQASQANRASQADQANQANQGLRDDGESGNRRRRRRGRDRNREGQPLPAEGKSPVSAPQAESRPPTAEEQFLGDPVEVNGLLDLRDEGYGFLRLKSYLPSKEDVYVSVKQVRQFNLRKGDHLRGAARPASRNEKNPALLRIDEVNGGDPEANKARARFEELTPTFPNERLTLEGADGADDATAVAGRIIDLVAPIGKGQRGLLIAPPKAGQTTLLKQIAIAVEANHPDVHLMVLLLDERPEEVTELRNAIEGEVISSTFDRPADEHTMIAELAIERAKRLVEDGTDVVILLDGLTRLARAYNISAPTTGRVLPGGIDAGAVSAPKRFFAAARNVDEGGSLTILATALTGTGASVDEAVLEELAGTANLELRLDGRLARGRHFPAIDVDASSTSHDELIVDRAQFEATTELQRELNRLANETDGGLVGLNLLLDRIGSSPTNAALVATFADLS